MDPAWQREIILANHLFEAVLGINGVKIVHNLRIGSEETLDCLRSAPRRSLCHGDVRMQERLTSRSPLVLWKTAHAPPVHRLHLREVGCSHGKAVRHYRRAFPAFSRCSCHEASRISFRPRIATDTRCSFRFPSYGLQFMVSLHILKRHATKEKPWSPNWEKHYGKFASTAMNC